MANATDNQITTFVVGKEVFGLGIHSIKEIVRYPEITEVPRVPRYIKGITNLRGIVMPVIDTRVKLKVTESEITEQTRVVVLDTGKTPTGIIVDRVKGVKNLEDAKVEPPLAIMSSETDKKYISGVIRTDQEIIMLLDLETLCEINLQEVKAGLQEGHDERALVDEKALEEESQLVTFIIANEEYAFPIETVREILRVSHITSVPDAPQYVIGLISVRNTLLPIIDVRVLFGLNSLDSDLVEEVNHLVSSGNTQELISWIDHFRTSSEQIGKALQELKQKTQEGIDLKSPCDNLIRAIKTDIKEDQRILVVEIGGVSIGLLVDRMRQVIRVPKRVIEPPSSLLKTRQSHTIDGIAKLDEGKRLIMLISGSNLFDEATIKELNKMSKKEQGQIDTRQVMVTEELQFVTFRLGKIEFAININDVQEINRLDSITAVPRAPEFIEGVMNLRGNVVPVIDLRTRFQLPKRQYDDTTRVIIVNLNKTLTGFIVDTVSEVLRVAKSAIEPPPKVIDQNLDMRFIEYICKLKGRMIQVINLSKVLTVKEMSELSLSQDQEQVSSNVIGQAVSEPKSEQAPQKKLLKRVED